MENRKKKVLLIEDDSDILFLIRTAVESAGHRVFAPAFIGNAETTWEEINLILSQEKPDVVVSDLDLPSPFGQCSVSTGINLIRQLGERDNPPAVIAMSAAVDSEILDRLRSLGVRLAIQKAGSKAVKRIVEAINTL